MIICAYCAFKGLDNYALYAVQVLGMDEVDGARLATYATYVRPFAAIGAGLLEVMTWAFVDPDDDAEVSDWPLVESTTSSTVFGSGLKTALTEVSERMVTVVVADKASATGPRSCAMNVCSRVRPRP